MKFKELPSAEYLLECFVYDPKSGLLTWRVRPGRHFASASYAARWNAKFSGHVSGRIMTNGRPSVVIGNNDFSQHRVIWKMVTGKDAQSEIDHRDCDLANNRWGNLRLASRSENGANRNLQTNNTSGFKGVSWWKRSNKWAATIRMNRKKYFLGFYGSAEDAYAAYCGAAERLHGSFTNYGVRR